MATDTASEAERALAMTIKVYEVNRDGITRVLREKAEVKPLDQPEYSHQFPDCRCPRCPESAR
ncbi:hypothetical protein ACPEIF_22405 [Streptomyces sp. NPDC012600]|uniref:Uncharacterized protein n=1 Tax=Streptomyces stephensoniae TaxID=3375367 RepID=A0ABU2W5V2_9ACTN|nr:hypothetical protein [Streptomyces griseus]MDT0492684.1 hypothetical protein [Streptomyces griseus]